MQSEGAPYGIYCQKGLLQSAYLAGYSGSYSSNTVGGIANVGKLCEGSLAHRKVADKTSLSRLGDKNAYRVSCCPHEHRPARHCIKLGIGKQGNHCEIGHNNYFLQKTS